MQQSLCFEKVPQRGEAAFSAEEARQAAAAEVFLEVARAGVLQVEEFSAEDLKQL